MGALIAITMAVFAAASMSAPLLGAGAVWDAGNALGFAALVGMLYLVLTSAAEFDVHSHRRLGYLVVLLVVAHAVWFPIADPVTLEYLQPGAPWSCGQVSLA